MIPCTSLPLSYVLISKRYFVASHIIHHLTNTEKEGQFFYVMSLEKWIILQVWLMEDNCIFVA